MASSEVKKGTNDGEEASVPLNFKTWVLRVSIHCEGCKRKVGKILRKIQGVSSVQIDQKQQMVTVTGNIDAATLIQRLTKAGKNAELWPQKPQKPVKPKNKERQSDPNNSKEPQEERHSVKTEAPEKDPSAKANGEGSGTAASNGKASQESEPASGGAGAEAKEAEQEGEEHAAASDGDRSAAGKQAVAGEGEGGAEKSGGNGGAGKKKKKQGQNGKNADGEGARSGEAPAGGGSGSEEQRNRGQRPEPDAADRSRPRQQAGQHPVPPRSNDAPASPAYQHQWEGQGPPRNDSPPPVSYQAVAPPYLISGHAPIPSTSYAEYHVPDYRPPHPYGHAYPGAEEEQPPYYSNTYHHTDSYGMFSEENPNACSIM